MAARKDYFGCPGELFWLDQGNSSGVELKIQNLPDVRLLFLPFLPMPLPKRKYNAVSAIADEIW